MSFPLCMTLCSHSFHPKSLLVIPENKNTIYSIFCPDFNFKSRCDVILKKTASSDNTLYLNGEQRNVTFLDFHCGASFHHETHTKVKQLSKVGKKFSKYSEYTVSFESSDQENCFHFKEHESSSSSDTQSHKRQASVDD